MGKRGLIPSQSRYRIVGKPPYVDPELGVFYFLLGIQGGFFMGKNTKKVLIILIGLVLFAVGIFEYYAIRDQSLKTRTNYNPETNYIYRQKDNFSYKGEEGKNALEILKAKTSVEQSSSGLVISINGRKADNSKHEYWAFYVNGKMAEVGPADYQTKAGDLIEWKIQKY